MSMLTTTTSCVVGTSGGVVVGGSQRMVSVPGAFDSVSWKFRGASGIPGEGGREGGTGERIGAKQRDQVCLKQSFNKEGPLSTI